MNAYEYTLLATTLRPYTVTVNEQHDSPAGIVHGSIDKRVEHIVMATDISNAAERIRDYLEQTGMIFHIIKTVPVLPTEVKLLWDLPEQIKIKPNPFTGKENQDEYNRQVDCALQDRITILLNAAGCGEDA